MGCLNLNQMGKKIKNTRLVYSTQSGRICPSCGKPILKCVCKKKSVPLAPGQTIRVRREVKGRKGKTVTVAFGFTMEAAQLKALAAELKRRCGSGGTVKDGAIIIQGDHRQTLLVELKRRNFKVTLAGG
jgi:translation initiation factor 1